jgi:hypothetical protein
MTAYSKASTILQYATLAFRKLLVSDGNAELRPGQNEYQGEPMFA